MKIYSTGIKIFISIFLCLNFCPYVSAQGNLDTSAFKNSIKLDLFPLYYDLFDYRDQIRAAIEYERKINNKSFAALYIDIGVFDDYTFIKYYDFFNQNQGMYSVEQKAIIKGIHIQPSYNYYFFTSKKKQNQGVFAGGIIDFYSYKKNLETYNSQTSEKNNYRYNQSKMGLGLHAGAKHSFTRRFFAEVKTSLYVKVYYHISVQSVNPIKPLNAQWTDSKYNFWWVTNFKIGYAF